jgi:hypothetical protein
MKYCEQFFPYLPLAVSHRSYPAIPWRYEDQLNKTAKKNRTEDIQKADLLINHHRTLEHRLGDFRECEKEAYDCVIECILQLRRDYEWECDIYILMAFLNPSAQFHVVRTCSEEAYQRVIVTLMQLIQAEINRDID